MYLGYNLYRKSTDKLQMCSKISFTNLLVADFGCNYTNIQTICKYMYGYIPYKLLLMNVYSI